MKMEGQNEKIEEVENFHKNLKVFIKTCSLLLKKLKIYSDFLIYLLVEN